MPCALPHVLKGACMKKVLRRVVALVLVLCFFSFAGCSVAARPVRASGISDKVVAKAGNVKILYEELYYLVMNRMREQRAQHGENYYDSAAAKEELAVFVAQNLCNESHALRSLGYDLGLDVEKGEIAERVQAHVEQILDEQFGGDRGKYVESLGPDYLTDHYLRVYLGTQEYLPTEMIVKMLEKGMIDSSDDGAKKILESDALIRTVQVYLAKNDPANTRELAESIRREIAEKPDNATRFDAMRHAIGGKYNDDHTDTTGDGYYFLRGEMDKAYEDAAFALENYAVSEVIEDEAGYYILMRLPKSETYIEENFQLLKEKVYIVRMNEKVRERYAEMTLEMTEFGQGLDLCALKAIDPAGGETLYVVRIVLICVAVFVLLGVGYYLIRRKGARGKKSVPARTKRKGN